MAKKEPAVGVGTAVIEPTNLTAHVAVKAVFGDVEGNFHEKFESAVKVNFDVAVRNALHDAVEVVRNERVGSLNERSRIVENYIARAEDFAQILVDVLDGVEHKVVQAIVSGLSAALSARQDALNSNSTADVTIDKLGASK